MWENKQIHILKEALNELRCCKVALGNANIKLDSMTREMEVSLDALKSFDCVSNKKLKVCDVSADITHEERNNQEITTTITTLKETTVKISGAGGKILHSKGYGNFNLKIGPLELQAQMIVGNVTDEILLRADILMDDMSGKADILLRQGKMILRGKTIALEQRFNPLPIKRVHLADTCILPAEI